jgi:hypothetical protein
MHTRQTAPRRPWSLGRWALPALLAVAAGCGGPGEGEVSGRVTYRNKPVPGGLVTFTPASGRANPVTVELDKDGNFPAVTLPGGEVHVSIDNRELAPAEELGDVTPNIPLSSEARKNLGVKKKKPAGAEKKKRPAKRSSRYVAIPEKYHKAETSGLTFTVKGGAQQKTFELTD